MEIVILNRYSKKKKGYPAVNMLKEKIVAKINIKREKIINIFFEIEIIILSFFPI